MLPAPARLRRTEEFKATLRSGVRVGRPTLVLHAVATQSPPSRAGFVVSGAVGGAVVRNRVKRRLRHLVAARLADAPPMDVVVRALPAAVSGDLATDFDSAWRSCLRKTRRA